MICEHLGIKGKTRVEPAIWEQFKYDAISGKKLALNKIIPHCLADVVSLNKAFDVCFKHVLVSISLR